MEEQFERIVAGIAERLRRRGWRLAIAESCTGGWIAKACTDLAGSSAWFDQAFVAYTNAAKQSMLGVTASVLASQGAVSRAVACAMAEGARLRSGAEVSMAVTGVAGPDGGSPDKPVGTVWFAWCVPGRETRSCRERFAGDRAEIRVRTVQRALSGLNDLLDQAS